MKDKTLPDKEIVKALEECIELKFDDTEYATVRLDTLTNALDFITRQQVENENLKIENQSLRTAANSLKMHYEEAQAEIEKLQYLLDEEEKKYTICAKHFYKEAIKEFAERLKDIFEQAYQFEYGYLLSTDVINTKIDNLVKEMVGENDD